MALNFPNNPQTGDTYLAPNNQLYLYDGEKWIGFVTPSGTIAQGITFVGDDSTGTRVSDGESFKIAGAGSVTTAVSGDTVTITGSASAQGITFVGDDSTGTRVSDGESFKIAGTQNITTSVSGDTVTITGPNLSSYITNSTLTVVGDDSTGVTLNSGETIKIAGTQNITTAVSGDTLTITGINTGDFAFSGNTLGTTSSNADIELDPAGTANLILKSGNFLPAADNTQYLGSASKRWHTLYVGPGSININGVTISESAGKLNIPGGVTGTQGLASIILPVPSSLPYGGQNDNLGNPFVFANNTVFYDHYTYLYIQGKVAAGGIWAGWTVGTAYPESLGFTPATFTHTHSNGALTQLTLASGGSGLSVAATDNIMAFRNASPMTTIFPTPYSGILGTVDAQGSSQDTLTTINQLTAGGTFTAQDQSLFFDNINIQTGANIVFSDSTTQNTAARITVVGDDSTGVTLNAGETIKIAGSGSITTAVSGDTITITGSASAQGITFVGDDSSGTRVSDGESFKIAGTQNITTAVSGDTLTITGPNLSSYLTAVPKTIDVNEISSGDSSAIQINDAVNISGAVTANAGLTINNNSNTWSFVSDGTLTLPAESGQIGRNGYPNGIDLYNNNGGTGYVRMNYADESVIWADAGGAHIQTTGGTWDFGTDGTLTFPDETTQNTAASITIVGDDSTGVTLNAGETIKIAGAGSITTAVSGDTITITGTGGGASIGDLTVDGTTISSGSSSKITLNESVDITGTLQVNDINSADSSAIQINDGVNVSGDLNVSGSINKVTITAPAAGSTLTIANGKTLTASNSLTFTGTDATSFAFPGTSGTVVTLAATQSLTNKTLTLPVIDNIKHGYSTTATAAGTTILTSTSNYMQFFTGSTTQILSLPAPQTMTLGQGFLIVNNSTGSVEVRASNSATVITVLPGTAALCISIDLTAGNGAAGWNAEFVGFSSVTGTGANVLAVSPTITGTLTANTFVTNDISSADSSAIQINDSLNASGTITATTFVTHGTGGSITGVNTLQVNEISSADSTAIQINDSVNISGTLNAKTLIANTISSEDSTAIQINDGLRISGDLTFSNNTVQTTAYVTASGNWTVTTGTNTYSFTVPVDGTYTMWVKGNIPNGIIIWNATVSVSNSNVAAIGYQYAWNYTGGGSPILLTAIPDQIRGSAGTISTDATYAGTTSNRFDFSIANSSGASQTIYYGYAKIS